MATTRNLVLDWAQYTAAAVAPGVFIPAGGWILTGGVTGARAWGEFRAMVLNFQAQPAIQVANDVRAPGAVQLLGTLSGANGVFDPVTAVAIGSSASSRFLRPGWAVSLSQAGALGSGSLYGIIELQY